VQDLIFIQAEIGSMFAFRWDGVDCFLTIKKSLSLAQESRKGRDIIAWKQFKLADPEVQYDETTDSKERDREAEDVDKRHDLE